MGRALFGIVAVFAQLRVDTIRENTRLGLAYARAQGRVGGRPTVMSVERVEVARQMRAQTPPATWETLAESLHVSSDSVRPALAQTEKGRRQSGGGASPWTNN